MIIFDLDNTLRDASHRIHLISQGENKWEAFLKAGIGDPPIPKNIMNLKYFNTQSTVEIWTGSSDFAKRETMMWLAENGILTQDINKYSQGNNDLGNNYCDGDGWFGDIAKTEASEFDPDSKILSNKRTVISRLRFRKHGDKTPDYVLKERWLDETLEEWVRNAGGFALINEIFEIVFDDKPSVVEM